jgi:hypothetical protein
VTAVATGSEAELVLLCVGPDDPHREACLVAEGFCPRCGGGLFRSYGPPWVGWCSCCLLGWHVANHRVTTHPGGEFLAWMVEMTEHDQRGGQIGKVGWAQGAAHGGIVVTTRSQ